MADGSVAARQRDGVCPMGDANCNPIADGCSIAPLALVTCRERPAVM